MRLWMALLLPVAALAQAEPRFFDRELREFLRLTDAQHGTIVENSSRHRVAHAGTLERVNTLNRDIENETRREQPDPGALGAKYQEIESQCRRYAESLGELNQIQLRALDDEQRTAVRNLAGQAGLSSLAVVAEAVFLLPKRDATAVFLGLDLTPVNDPAPVHDVPADLAVFLNLTAAQLDAIRSVVRGHRDFVASRRARAAEVNQEIEAEMARPAPSGIELGTRYWEIEAHRRQMEEREASLRRSTPGLLNAEQRAKLALLAQPVELLRAISQAESNGLLVAPASLPASQPGGPAVIFLQRPVPFPFPIGGVTPASPGRSCIGARLGIFDPVPL